MELTTCLTWNNHQSTCCLVLYTYRYMYDQALVSYFSFSSTMFAKLSYHPRELVYILFGMTYTYIYIYIRMPIPSNWVEKAASEIELHVLLTNHDSGFRIWLLRTDRILTEPLDSGFTLTEIHGVLSTLPHQFMAYVSYMIHAIVPFFPLFFLNHTTFRILRFYTIYIYIYSSSCIFQVTFLLHALFSRSVVLSSMIFLLVCFKNLVGVVKYYLRCGQIPR